MGDGSPRDESWHDAVPDLLERVAAIEDAVAALLAGALADEERERARRAAHRLAGTLGTVGLAEASVTARDVETAFEEAPPPGAAPRLAERALGLRRAIEAGPPPGGGDNGATRVVLAGLDGERAGAIMRAAGDRGWRLASADEPPAPGGAEIVLLDPGAAGNAGDLLEVIGGLVAGGAAVAVLAGPDADRLALARAGADRVIAAAARPEAVVRELAELERALRGAESTILAVDDDPLGLTIVQSALEGAGHRVETCSEATDVWAALERVRPDLVVLDVQMPGADGTEICRALRADPRWRGLPVLFLTATTSPSAVAEMFAAGGDDYIPKPIEARELTARVAGRLERMRQVRATGDVDDLTGLLGRPVAEPRLERLAGVAGRLGLPFAIVAVGLDRAGELDPEARDAALATAGRAARDVLQTGDAGAVWGGGDLVLGLLAGDPAHAAETVLAAVRADGATASAGIAEHPRDGEEASILVATAFAARRAAASAGGDRVELAGAPAGEREHVDVVLVEDDQVLARLILDALELRGLRVRWLPDGDEAAHMLGGDWPPLHGDVILLDWDLPARDGLTVLRGLSGDGVLASSHVVMLTARASQREVLTALELGASDHVAKPFSLAVLMQRVQRALGR